VPLRPDASRLAPAGCKPIADGVKLLLKEDLGADLGADRVLLRHARRRPLVLDSRAGGR
jgi:hypothetical protein